VVNKVDNGNRAKDAVEFLFVGARGILYYCQYSGSGTGDLLDELVKVLPEKEKEEG